MNEAKTVTYYMCKFCEEPIYNDLEGILVQGSVSVISDGNALRLVAGARLFPQTGPHIDSKSVELVAMHINCLKEIAESGEPGLEV